MLLVRLFVCLVGWLVGGFVGWLVVRVGAVLCCWFVLLFCVVLSFLLFC